MESKLLLLLLLVLSVGTLVSTERLFTSEWEALNARNIPEDSTDFWVNITTQVRQLSQAWAVGKYAEWQTSKARLVPGSISDQCLKVIDHILLNFLGEDKWTAQVVDSMGGLPAGMLSMSHTSFGDFDQCLSIADVFQEQPFVGKYCLATVEIPRQSFFRAIARNDSQLPVGWFGNYIQDWYNNDNYYSSASGVCFPSICRPEEIRSAIIAHYPIVGQFDFNVTHCQSKEEPSLPDSRIWLGIVIVAIPWILIPVGTLLELFCCCRNSGNFLFRFIFGFSLISNIKFLFHISTEKKNEEFQFVHGIRAIASLFIVVAHSAGFIYVNHQVRISPFSRYPFDMQKMSKMLVAQPFYSGALAVLVFFVMSGMFLAKGTLMKGRLRVNFFVYVALRYLRFTPSLVGLIGLNYVAELFGSGPLFHHDIIWPTIHGCYEHWTQNLLYLSNYENLNEMCNVQIWYLSSEMQMHVIAFVLIALYARSSRMTYFASFLMIATGIVAVIVLSGSGFVKINVIQLLMYPQNTVPTKLAKYIFFHPLMNMIAYFVGFALGIFLLEKRRDRLSPLAVRVIWIFATIILVASPFASYPKAQTVMENWDRNPWEAGVEFSVAIFAWSAAVAWAIWRFIVNPANPVARMLAAKFWQPMSRLSFSLYLSHILVIWFNSYNIRNTINLGDITEVFKMVSIAIIEGYVLALFIYVTFEAPSVNFLRMLMPAKKRENKNPESTESLRDMKMDKNANLRGNLSD